MLLIGLTFIVITVVGLVGNSMVIFVIGMNKQLHESTSIFICNLALADLLFLAFCVPITAYSYVYSWEFSQAVCYVSVTLQYVTCYVSVWTLVLLAYDRFISVTTQGLTKSLRRSHTVVYVCLGVWLAIFGLNFFQMRNVGVLSISYNDTLIQFCVDNVGVATNTSSTSDARLFYWGFNLGAYVFPLALSCLFYFLLVRMIWRQKLVQSKSSQRIKRHATKMVFVVILTFGLCWFPQNMRFFLRGLSYPEASRWETELDPGLLLWVQCAIQLLAYANSCVNPILYGIVSERFRVGFRRVCRRFMLCSRCGGNRTGAGGGGGFVSMVAAAGNGTHHQHHPQQQQQQWKWGGGDRGSARRATLAGVIAQRAPPSPNAPAASGGEQARSRPPFSARYSLLLCRGNSRRGRGGSAQQQQPKQQLVGNKTSVAAVAATTPTNGCYPPPATALATTTTNDGGAAAGTTTNAAVTRTCFVVERGAPIEPRCWMQKLFWRPAAKRRTGCGCGERGALTSPSRATADDDDDERACHATHFSADEALGGGAHIAHIYSNNTHCHRHRENGVVVAAAAAAANEPRHTAQPRNGFIRQILVLSGNNSRQRPAAAVAHLASSSEAGAGVVVNGKPAPPTLHQQQQRVSAAASTNTNNAMLLNDSRFYANATPQQTMSTVVDIDDEAASLPATPLHHRAAASPPTRGNDDDDDDDETMAAMNRSKSEHETVVAASATIPFVDASAATTAADRSRRATRNAADENGGLCAKYSCKQAMRDEAFAFEDIKNCRKLLDEAFVDDDTDDDDDATPLVVLRTDVAEEAEKRAQNMAKSSEESDDDDDDEQYSDSDVILL